MSKNNERETSDIVHVYNTVRNVKKYVSIVYVGRYTSLHYTQKNNNVDQLIFRHKKKSDKAVAKLYIAYI